MSVSDTGSKVSADHLRRDAYLYVRQSSLHRHEQHRVLATPV